MERDFDIAKVGNFLLKRVSFYVKGDFVSNDKFFVEGKDFSSKDFVLEVRVEDVFCSGGGALRRDSASEVTDVRIKIADFSGVVILMSGDVLKGNSTSSNIERLLVKQVDGMMGCDLSEEMGTTVELFSEF